MALFIAALVLSPPVRQPVSEAQGRRKLVLRNLAIPKVPAGAYMVISQGVNFDGPIKVRLVIHGRTRSHAQLPGWMFTSDGETRLFQRGSDYLLAFRSGSGTTMFTNFVRISASPPRVIAETVEHGSVFEYAPLYHFQADGRFDEHLRHVLTPRDLYLKHWLWSTGKHRFVMTGGSRIDHWRGWDDQSLR